MARKTHRRKRSSHSLFTGKKSFSLGISERLCRTRNAHAGHKSYRERDVIRRHANLRAINVKLQSEDFKKPSRPNKHARSFAWVSCTHFSLLFTHSRSRADNKVVGSLLFSPFSLAQPPRGWVGVWQFWCRCGDAKLGFRQQPLVKWRVRRFQRVHWIAASSPFQPQRGVRRGSISGSTLMLLAFHEAKLRKSLSQRWHGRLMSFRIALVGPRVVNFAVENSVARRWNWISCSSLSSGKHAEEAHVANSIVAGANEHDVYIVKASKQACKPRFANLIDKTRLNVESSGGIMEQNA